MSSRALLTVLTGAVVACSGQAHRGTPSPTTTRPTQSQVAADDTTLYVLDGRLIRREDVTRIDRKQVVAVQHLVGEAVRARYGPSAREVVAITTWMASDTTARAAHLYFLDGTEIPAHLARVLDPAKIASIEVLKGATARFYGERAAGGVVLVKSKTGTDE